MQNFLKGFGVLAAAFLISATLSAFGGNPLSSPGGLPLAGGTLTGDLTMGSGANIIVGAGGTLLNETPTSINPSFAPSSSDLDTGIGHAGTDELTLVAGSQEALTVTTTGTRISGGALNGEFLNIKSVTIPTSAMTSGATITLTDLIPADSLVMAVVARVTTTITGPTSWLLGVSGDTNQWGDILALAAGTTVDYADYTNVKPPEFFAAATSVLITRGSASDFTAGVVRVTVIYFDATPPTQ